MTVLDKNNLLPTIKGKPNVEVELGCGNRKRVFGSIGIDILDYECVDIVGDVFEVLEQFPADSVTAVHAHHVIEHLADLGRLMDALARVVKKEGSLHFVVPHFSNPYFYSDYTHRSFFGLYTFSYLCVDRVFRRRVPSYKRELAFELVRADLGFKSTWPFVFRHSLKFLIGKIFNCTTYTKEFYEENLAYLIPCYEISFHLKRV